MAAGLPYFAGKGPVPDLPHLIIVPGSVLQQWQMEIKKFFTPESVDVFVLPTAKDTATKLWTDSWAKSVQPMYRCIVIMAHLVRLLFLFSLTIRLDFLYHNQPTSHLLCRQTLKSIWAPAGAAYVRQHLTHGTRWPVSTPIQSLTKNGQPSPSTNSTNSEPSPLATGPFYCCWRK
jgi:SNF2-related domain